MRDLLFLLYFPDCPPGQLCVDQDGVAKESGVDSHGEGRGRGQRVGLPRHESTVVVLCVTDYRLPFSPLCVVGEFQVREAHNFRLAAGSRRHQLAGHHQAIFEKGVQGKGGSCGAGQANVQARPR